MPMARPKSKLTLFIESTPLSTPTAEVVARAKAEGYQTSESNVQRVRQVMRKSSAAPSISKPAAKSAKAKPAPTRKAKAKKSKRAKPMATKPVVAPRSPAAPAAPAPAPAANVAALRKLVLELGLRTSEAVLKDLRARLASL